MRPSSVSLGALLPCLCAVAFGYLPVVDIAPFSRITAGSWHDEAWAPERAADGDPDTFWRQPRDEYPTWWQAEFTAAQRLFGVVLHWVVQPDDLSVLVETDGEWTLAARVTNNTQEITEIFFDRPRLARRVRIIIEAAQGKPFIGLAEVECLVGAAEWYRSPHEWSVPTLSLPRTWEAPNIDGKLDDACWIAAATTTPFLLLNTGEPASDQTIAYLASDEHHLYVAFRCLSATPTITADPGSHDRDMANEDAVGLLIDTNLDQISYIEIAVNAAGARYDALSEDIAWDMEWFSDVWVDEDGWSCEIAIPFESLHLGLGTKDTWGINLWRRRPLTNERSSWAPTAGTVRRPTHFGRLTDVRVDPSLWRGLEDLRILAATENFVVIWGDSLDLPPRHLSVEQARKLKPNTDAIRLSMAEGETEPIRLMVAAINPHATGVVRLTPGTIHEAQPPLDIPGVSVEDVIGTRVFRIGFINDQLADVLVPGDRHLLTPGRTANFWMRLIAGHHGGHTYHSRLHLEFIGADIEERIDIPVEWTIWPIRVPEKPRFATAGFPFSLAAREIGLASSEPRFTEVLDRVKESYRLHRISLDGGYIGPDVPLPPLDATAELASAYIPMATPWLEAGYRINRPPWFDDDPERREPWLRFWNDLAVEQGWTDVMHVPYRLDLPPFHLHAVVSEASQMAQAAPNLRRLLLQPEYSPEMELVRELVDEWAFRAPSGGPETDDVLRFCRERQAAGDRIWWYVRDALALDAPLMSIRSFFWMCARFGIDGAMHGKPLHWDELGVDIHAAADRFEVRDTGPPSAGILSWPDPHAKMVYESLRWELLRDGIEDWELISQLLEMEREEPDLDVPTVEELVSRVVVRPSHYSLLPRRLHDTRDAVAQIIMARKRGVVPRQPTPTAIVTQATAQAVLDAATMEIAPIVPESTAEVAPLVEPATPQLDIAAPDLPAATVEVMDATPTSQPAPPPQPASPEVVPATGEGE